MWAKITKLKLYQQQTDYQDEVRNWFFFLIRFIMNMKCDEFFLCMHWQYKPFYGNEYSGEISKLLFIHIEVGMLSSRIFAHFNDLNTWTLEVFWIRGKKYDEFDFNMETKGRIHTEFHVCNILSVFF